MDSRLLLQALLDRQIVTAAEIERALAQPGHHGQALEWILVDESVVEEPVLLALMSELYGLPLVTLTPDNVDVELASQLPTRLLREYCVYPLAGSAEGELYLATADPFDILCEDTMRQVTGRTIRLALAPKAQIESAVDGKLVSGEGLRLLIEGVPEIDTLEGLGDVLEAEGELSENAGPIIKLVDSILRDAIRRQASDIHIEPQEDSFRVRFRIDGILRPVVKMPKRVERTCVSRLKIMSGIDISESRKAQDGRISVRTVHGKVNMRVNTIPGSNGEKVVLRILDENAVRLDLDSLGLSAEGLKIFRSHIASSNGMILITGPTGSGKTSTLYAALRVLNSPDVNITTIEDPIEYMVPGLTQVSVHVKAGLTFASALRAFLRQDPDIIMVGEVRDLETAETAIQAAQTGHLVFSTLHTNDAPATISRLVLMGAETHNVADSLLCVMAQRLVRKICPHCRGPAMPRPEQVTLLKLAIEEPLMPQTFAGKGCDECGGTGYRGRLGLYEILTVTSSIRTQMLVDPSEQALWQVARSEGMTTLLEDGLAKVNAGITTLDEVLRVVTIRRRPGSDPAALTSAAPAPATATQVPADADQVGAAPVPLVATTGAPKIVRHLMSTRLMTVGPNMTLQELGRLFAEKRLTACPVIAPNGLIVGVVSMRDLIAAEYLPERMREAKTVREVMSSRVISVGPDEPTQTAAQLLWRHKIHHLLVLENKSLVGIVTPFDLMMS